MLLIIRLTLFLFILSCSTIKAPKPGVFVGYELVEMSLNEFDEFAGEVGYNFDSINQIRLIRMQVNLKERHLEGDEASAVTGSGVSGEFNGWELSYDRYLFGGNYFLSLNTGQYEFNYKHTDLPLKSENDSRSYGIGFGHTDNDLFGVQGLYLTFSYSLRMLVDKVDKKILGSATVNELKSLDNIWFFLGYKF